MEFTSQSENNFFIAAALTVFTFCFVFLGTRLTDWYYAIGLACLIASVVYWIKFKRAKIAEFQSL